MEVENAKARTRCPQLPIERAEVQAMLRGRNIRTHCL